LALAQEGVVEVPTKYKSFADLLPVINTITNYIFTALIVFAVIMVIIAGFNFLTAGGDPIKAGTARSQLIYALVAIAIGALAKGLIYMVATLMGVSGI
jgi:hypothetical protein